MGFKDRLTETGDKLGPAPTWGEFGSDVASDVLTDVPPLLGAATLGGYGIGRLAGGTRRAGSTGAGAGAGLVGGMTLGSALSQALAKAGGPLFGLDPKQTHALMARVNAPGTIGGGLLGSYLGGRMAHHMADPDHEKISAIQKRAALKSALNIVGTAEAYPFHHMIEAAKEHSNIIPMAAGASALGGAGGYALGDMPAGIGLAGGSVLGHAGGNILGRGLGALGGLAVGRLSGMKHPQMQQMMDQWASGGSDLGKVLGTLYGGYKGIGLARRVAQNRSGKEAAARVLVKMGQGATVNLGPKPPLPMVASPSRATPAGRASTTVPSGAYNPEGSATQMLAERQGLSLVPESERYKPGGPAVQAENPPKPPRGYVGQLIKAPPHDPEAISLGGETGGLPGRSTKSEVPVATPWEGPVPKDTPMAGGGATKIAPGQAAGGERPTMIASSSTKKAPKTMLDPAWTKLRPDVGSTHLDPNNTQLAGTPIDPDMAKMMTGKGGTTMAGRADQRPEALGGKGLGGAPKTMLMKPGEAAKLGLPAAAAGAAAAAGGGGAGGTPSIPEMAPDATPPAAAGSKGWGLSMPQLGRADKWMLRAGLGTAGAIGLGSLLAHQGRQTRAYEAQNMQREFDRDFLEKQRSAQMNRERAMLEQLKYPDLYRTTSPTSLSVGR